MSLTKLNPNLHIAKISIMISIIKYCFPLVNSNFTSVTKGDVNGDGLEDLFVGNGSMFSVKLYLQKGNELLRVCPHIH